MKTNRQTKAVLPFAAVAMAALALPTTQVHSQELLAVDFGSAGAESGFVAQSSTSVTHTTTAGDITVALSGVQSLFDFATSGTNDLLYRDFYFKNNGTITMTLSGPGISAGTDYDLTFWSYYGAEGRNTTFDPGTGTAGPALGPIALSNSPAPSALLDPLYSISGTYTSDGSGVLTILVGGTGNRPAINALRISAVSGVPVIVSTDPTDGALEAPIATDLVATFNEAVEAGTGNITLKRTSDNFTVESFDVTSSLLLNFGGTTVTINPTADLVPTVGYHVLVDGTAIKAVDDGALFAGLSTSGDWNFTGDGTAPTLATSDIVDDQGGGPVLQDVLITYTLSFNEDIDAGTLTASDFGDLGGDVSFTVGTISETAPGVFTVEVTPTSPGNLDLQINQSAVVEDASGNALDTTSAIVDDDSITVDPPDTTPPTLLSSDIVDDQGGGPVNQGTLVTYTVFFSEDMDDTTVDAADFGNAGSSNITIGTISETAPGEFSVQVTPTDAGTLQLEVVIGATLADPSGNPLDTTTAITDDTTITVEEPFAGSITVSSYVYGANAESQPQPTSFQGGSISDVGNVKLTDGAVATGSWNDFTNVGFRNDSDNGNPQPQVTFDLGSLQTVATVDVFSVTAFLGSDESASISSSVDGVNFSTPVTVDPLTWTGGFPNSNLRQASVDASSLPAGQFYRLEVFDPGQWMMINEVVFYAGTSGGNDFSDWIAGYSVGGQDGVGDDPDRDGIASGVENIFGTAPDAFSPGLVAGAVSGNTFTFTHPLNANPADDLTAIYRWSDNLKTAFYDDGASNGAGTTTVSFSQGTPSGGMVTVTATITGTVIPDKLFVNVQVTQP